MTRLAITLLPTLLVSTLLIAPVFAEEEELKPLAIGKSAPAWTNLPGVDGKKHSLADLAERKAVVLVFFENVCPDCELYTKRIAAIARDYEKRGVATVLMNVVPDEENSLAEMKKLVAERKIPCAYVWDKSQRIGKAYGATVTPQVYIFDRARKLAYRGAVDDHFKVSKVARRHARIALDEILAGKRVSKPVTEALGCDIEYD